jgi:hypothetical protein
MEKAERSKDTPMEEHMAVYDRSYLYTLLIHNTNTHYYTLILIDTTNTHY